MSMQELPDDTPSRDGEHHQSVMMHRFPKHLHPSSGPLAPALYVPEEDGPAPQPPCCEGALLVKAAAWKQAPQRCSEGHQPLPLG